MNIFGTDPIIQIVKASDARKKKADLWLKYYMDLASDETLRLIKAKWSNPEDFRIFTVNATKKITNLRASIYRTAPRRTFKGIDQEAGENLYRELGADVLLKRASRLTKLLKTCVLQVGLIDDRITLSTITPNILDAEWNHPEHPTRLIVTHKGEREQDVTYSDWTADRYARRDYRGHPITVGGNPNGVNPFGILPFVPLFDRYPDDGFFLPGGDDLIEGQQAVNVALSNLWRAVELQAHGQAWATGIPAGDALRTGPERAITLPEGGTFGFASPDAPIHEILEAIEFVLRQIAATNDCSADVFDISKKAESGSAKLVEQRDLLEARADDIDLWRRYEMRLFEVIKTVANTRTPGMIPEDASVHVDFAEFKEFLSESDRLANYAARLELGISSPVDLFLSDNPDFGSREEVFAELQRRKEETDQLTLTL